MYVLYFFGREKISEDGNKNDNKRRNSSGAHYFCSSRVDNYMSHLLKMHTKKWEEYKLIITNAENIKFFLSNIPYSNKLEAHFNIRVPQTYKIDLNNVN